MNYRFVPDAFALPLLPRPGYDAMIRKGNPRAFGRVVALSDDKRTARVVWRATPGTYAFSPDATTVDVGVILKGKIIVRCPGRPDLAVGAGGVIEFPREPFELDITEEFVKVSFLYNPQGLRLEAEPL